MVTPIQRAVAYVSERVIDPALENPDLEESIKNRVRNSRTWLTHFRRVGDLIVYLQRFKGTVSSDTYSALKARNLLTFEDILDEFEAMFSVWASDRTTASSFVVGDKYDSYQILILVGAYDTRAGGMFLLGRPEAPDAVVIKATLKGGRYPNSWIETHMRLKYYLKSRGGVFGEHFQENAAILNQPHVPILSFVRNTDQDLFTFEGVFARADIHREVDGSKWFELVRPSGGAQLGNVVDQNFDDALLAGQVDLAKALSPEELARKLAEEPRLPRKVTVQATSFVRSPFVIAAVLTRAQGECDQCRKPAPFAKRIDKAPYLEVHHKVRLADGGEDTVDNAIALCPNCHRQAHYG